MSKATAFECAPMDVLVRAAETAPADALFVMAGPMAHVLYPRKHKQVTLHAFTPGGKHSRMLESGPSGWSWVHEWMGGPLPWSKLWPYDDGWTPERTRDWHEGQHGWYLVQP